MILLDTDVLLDVALGRSMESGDLLRFLEVAPIGAFVAWHTLSNFYYVFRPVGGGRLAKDFLVDLTEFVTVAPTNTDSLRYAANLPLSDLEDAMQVAAARACGAEVIATRNVRDFAKSPIRARTPKQLLAELV